MLIAAALAALGPHLATTQFFDAFTAAKAIRDEEERTKALTELARYLPAELLSDAVVLARAIRDEHTRAKVLAALAPHLPPEGAAIFAGFVVSSLPAEAQRRCADRIE